MLNDSDRLLDRAQKLDVHLILSGHLHDNCPPFFPRGASPQVWTAQPAFADWTLGFPAPVSKHGFHILEFELGRAGNPRHVSVSRRNFDIRLRRRAPIREEALSARVAQVALTVE